jgi:hypothetical protein
MPSWENALFLCLMTIYFRKWVRDQFQWLHVSCLSDMFAQLFRRTFSFVTTSPCKINSDLIVRLICSFMRSNCIPNTTRPFSYSFWQYLYFNYFLGKFFNFFKFRVIWCLAINKLTHCNLEFPKSKDNRSSGSVLICHKSVCYLKCYCLRTLSHIYLGTLMTIRFGLRLAIICHKHEQGLVMTVKKSTSQLKVWDVRIPVTCYLDDGARFIYPSLVRTFRPQVHMSQSG